MLFYTVFEAPICPVLAAVDESGAVARVEFLAAFTEAEALAQFGHEKAAVPDKRRTAALQNQLEEYFSGGRRTFDLPLSVSGTPFQRRVWDELRRIPYGETRTYGQIAASLGRPTACRAVGGANGANRIPIIIPCHRVIGADGSLTGFAGGKPIKAFLLELEGMRLKEEIRG